MTRQPKASHGFTLVELMVTVTIMAILTMIALPSYRDTIRRNQVNSASNALLASLNYARAEAITRAQIVTLCPSATAAGCTSGGTAWENGWMVYTYPAGAASSNAAYATGNVQLRSTTAQGNVSIWAGQATYPSYGMQGQLKPSTTLRYITCFRDSGGTVSSTSAVPGVELDVRSSGSIISKTIASGGSCSS